MPAFGGAYSDVDPPCQLRHLGLRQQGVAGHRQDVAELGTKRPNDQRLMAANGAKPTRGDKVGEVRARRLIINLHGISGR
jgi:hypothetical protein